MRRESLARVLLVLLGTVVGLGVSELIVRFIADDNLRDVRRTTRERVFDPLPGVRYLYEAGASHKEIWPSDPKGYFDQPGNSLTYSFNNYGFRDDDFSIKLGSSCRIAFLGDSFCWGAGVRKKDRFSEILENDLNVSEIDLQFETYNFALPGWNTENEAALYQYVVSKFSPDLLVVSFFINDINDPPEIHVFPRGILREESKVGLRKYSAFYRLLMSGFDNRRIEKEFVENTRKVYSPTHAAFQKMKNQLSRIASIAKSDNTEIILLIFPWLFHLDDNLYPFTEAHELVGKHARSEGYIVIDLLGKYKGFKKEELWVHQVDHHPNAYAHHLASEALLKVVMDTVVSDTIFNQAMKDRREGQILSRMIMKKQKDWYRLFQVDTISGSNGGLD